MNRWVPVRESLPEDGGKYLITVSDNYFRRYTTVANFRVDEYGNYRFGGFDPENVVAWMDMPRPYISDPEEKKSAERDARNEYFKKYRKKHPDNFRERAQSVRERYIQELVKYVEERELTRMYLLECYQIDSLQRFCEEIKKYETDGTDFGLY